MYSGLRAITDDGDESSLAAVIANERVRICSDRHRKEPSTSQRGIGHARWKETLPYKAVN